MVSPLHVSSQFKKKSLDGADQVMVLTRFAKNARGTSGWVRVKKGQKQSKGLLCLERGLGQDLGSQDLRNVPLVPRNRPPPAAGVRVDGGSRKKGLSSGCVRNDWLHLSQTRCKTRRIQYLCL